MRRRDSVRCARPEVRRPAAFGHARRTPRPKLRSDRARRLVVWHGLAPVGPRAPWAAVLVRAIRWMESRHGAMTSWPPLHGPTGPASSEMAGRAAPAAVRFVGFVRGGRRVRSVAAGTTPAIRRTSHWRMSPPYSVTPSLNRKNNVAAPAFSRTERSDRKMR